MFCRVGEERLFTEKHNVKCILQIHCPTYHQLPSSNLKVISSIRTGNLVFRTDGLLFLSSCISTTSLDKTQIHLSIITKVHLYTLPHHSQIQHKITQDSPNMQIFFLPSMLARVGSSHCRSRVGKAVPASPRKHPVRLSGLFPNCTQILTSLGITGEEVQQALSRCS